MTETPHDLAALRELLRRAGLDTVEGAFAYAGEKDLAAPDLGHRQRWRLCLTGDDGAEHVLYMKRYEREPLSWRVKRWFTYGFGRGPARIEADNIAAAHAAHLPTMHVAAVGERADRWGAARGYIIVTAVPGAALEKCAADFLARHAADPAAIERFTRLLADLVGRFHRAGFVHRDLYGTHLFLDESGGRIDLYLIDLARVFRPRWRRFRWLVKDLGELKFSMPADWVAGYWELFLDGYFAGSSVRRGRWAAAIDRKAESIRRQLDRRRRRREKAGLRTD